MCIAGVTSHRPRTTRASSSTAQMSDAVISCHHSPHGWTTMPVCPSSCQVMCPAIFSANPIPARCRNATASACSLDSSTPIGGITEGAQASRPPRRALGTFMIGLHRGSNFVAELALGDLSPRRSREFVEHDQSFGQQFLRNSLRQQMFSELRQGDLEGLAKLGAETDSL